MFEYIIKPILGTLLIAGIVSLIPAYYMLLDFRQKEAAREYALAAFFLMGVAGMIVGYITTGNPFAHF